MFTNRNVFKKFDLHDTESDHCGRRKRSEKKK